MLEALSFIPEKADSAIVLCHGYGADGNDLFTLKDRLLQDLNKTAFACPNAPKPLMFGGYEWFSLDDYQPDKMQTYAYLQECTKRAQAGAAAFQDYLKDFIDKTGIPMNRLILGGFSQGGLIAALAAFHEDKAPAGLMMMSAVPLLPSETFKRHSVPILITQGLSDPVVPPEGADITSKTLQDLGNHPHVVRILGLEHGIDEICLNESTAFIHRVFEKVRVLDF